MSQSDTDLTTGGETSLQKLKKSSPEIFNEGGYYNLKGNKIPDSKKISENTNALADQGLITLNTAIIECDKNNDKAWARVRCTNEKTGQYQEGYVVHHYNTLKDVWLMDLVKSYEKQEIPNPIEKMVNGRFILTSPAERALAIRTINFKKFAERDAATKAARIAQFKMLNRDWRTLEEKQSEDEEVLMVNK